MSLIIEIPLNTYLARPSVAAIAQATEDIMYRGPLSCPVRGMRPIPIPDPTGWLHQRIVAGEITGSLCNGREDAFASLGAIVFRSAPAPVGKGRLKLSVRGDVAPPMWLPLMRAIAPLSEAIYGHAGGIAESARMQLLARNGEMRMYPARILDPRVPPLLCWINYWSGATLAYLGTDLDDLVRRGLCAHAEPCADGVLWQLTAEPLDLDRADHAAAAAAARAAFPIIDADSPDPP
jgi:hypothetical protein